MMPWPWALVSQTWRKVWRRESTAVGFRKLKRDDVWPSAQLDVALYGRLITAANISYDGRGVFPAF